MQVEDGQAMPVRAVDAARALPPSPNLQLPDVPGGRGWPVFGHTLNFVGDAKRLVDRKFADTDRCFRFIHLDHQR